MHRLIEVVRKPRSKVGSDPESEERNEISRIIRTTLFAAWHRVTTLCRDFTYRCLDRNQPKQVSIKSESGGQRRDRTADAGLFRARLPILLSGLESE